MDVTRAALALPLLVACADGQTTSDSLPTGISDPFPTPIVANEDVITLGFVEFASIPDVDGEAARMNHLVDEPATGRLFVNGMRGALYSVSHDGKAVTLYLDLDAERWGVDVKSSRSERGFQSFAFHPQFNQPGTPGFGKLYTLTDTANEAAAPDFAPPADSDKYSHDTVLLEWTARNPGAASYDGDLPRELMRFAQPSRNHNGGDLQFNPLASPGDADFGLLYMGVADGGGRGDKLGLAQNLGSGFGKILRIDPLGSSSANGRYGIPADNPFAGDGNADTLGEIYAFGIRNPQRLAWDLDNGNLFVSDIGQGTVEEISRVTAGANLGWNEWEGSFVYIYRNGVHPDNVRGDASVTYPVVEYDHVDPALQPAVATTLCCVYRHDALPRLKGLLLFGDIPSGELFYVNADDLPEGGQDAIRRVLLDADGQSRTLLELIREKNAEQGRPPSSRADLRFDVGRDGRLFVLNKRDGTIRQLLAASS